MTKRILFKVNPIHGKRKYISIQLQFKSVEDKVDFKEYIQYLEGEQYKKDILKEAPASMLLEALAAKVKVFEDLQEDDDACYRFS